MTLVWLALGATLLFLYGPLLPPILESLRGNGFLNYQALLDDSRLQRAVWTSLLSGLLVAILTPIVALLAAQALRRFGKARWVLGLVLLPLFVPGVAMGVATALFFQLLGLKPSLLTIVTVQTLWALPFAFLIIMTAMASFDRVFLEAAHMSGAGPLRAFFEIELPLIRQGITGAALFSLILSFNETIRTSLVQGGRNTIATYIWAQYRQVGLAPNLYALMTILILTTLALLITLALVERRR
jgi:ABC-type spermidine/putrescine transport system permease subunit II